MIPMPLASAHAAFLAWLSRTGATGEFNPMGLPDEELAELRAVLVEIYDDVRNGLARIDAVIAKRAMARSNQTRQTPAGPSPSAEPGAPPGQSDAPLVSAPGALR